MLVVGGCPDGEEREPFGARGACCGGVGGDGQAGLTGHREHVVVDLDVADLWVPVDLGAVAVLVDVLVGPVLAELGLRIQQLADEAGGRC